MRFFSYWTGGPLSTYEKLSIKSFLDHGHKLSLYSNMSAQELELPYGVELVDSKEILPTELIRKFGLENGTRSYAIESDYFRFKKLSLDVTETWIDMDFVCLSSDWNLDTDFLIGIENGRIVNTAVIGLQGQQQLASDLFSSISKVDWSRVKWGDTGPRFLTSELEKRNLLNQCLPEFEFYPIHFSGVSALYDPSQLERVKQIISQSRGIHLWNEVLTKNFVDKSTCPPIGSFLHSLFEKHGLLSSFSSEAMPLTWLPTLRNLQDDYKFEFTRAENLERIRIDLVLQKITTTDELAEAEKKSQLLQVKLEQAEQEFIKIEQEFIKIKSSWSWVVTKPLRFIAKIGNKRVRF